MIQVILDTNFLMAVSQFRIDIFAEIQRICDFRYKLYIIDKTLDELKGLIEQNKGKDGRAAKLALSLIKQKHISIIKTDKDRIVDDLIMNIVNKEHIVATQDKELKSRLKQKNIGIISIRQKRYLKLE
ncbi:MAG: hypothetical protein QF362_00955 [Candidatus Woesearchaeota archaeon]|jgi:hypothetical protein|nr:hypothetical protein [Candidatus Woesearchaeota archaeon]MDP7505999.1 hypothetical protein [Candidatus Woesearchaeota archaeon]MDP7610462.1 hypothetical protein [Candidatus Woesearchaeota archaeon]|tara:strand:- start:541 stop:924 length:384 start_codon:yes stop_codon:yes gene_type:complete